ncbi:MULTISPECIES: HTH-type sugar sensing transcriptional regulator TrmB [Halolamina]|uniref:Sugar-specific transcriptional regulator TrmB n=1 Tax=Halolamina pelagica TaxID=699431 RepID=A0A1I5R1G2_9EURY|nr:MULTISPECIES: TrmB family transcriptional regulator [Halolamina]NHX35623.1 TrmB family transcriptional regulator [Halolamina sp. R1-12]SFP51896.1 Sugar-specific transcriptional regulator TrmB [Halolamina pelagica]
MHDDDLRVALERVGETFDFGEYEIEAYLAVLEHGRLSATEIAERTDIPQPRVYDTVRSLAEHGFVELQESRPMKVLAVDPEEAFGGVRSSLDDLVSGLEQRYTAPARDAEAVTLIKSPATIERYLREIVESAEYELLLSLTPDLLAEFESALRAKREAGVTIELLVSPTAEVPDADAYEYTDVATTVRSRRGVTTPVAAVADGQFSLYATREALHGGEERYGVVFNRSELGFLVSGFVSTVLWASGETLAVTPERELPRRYASLRRCVEELQALSGPLRASVEGRDVLTGEPRDVSGEVVDTTLNDEESIAAFTVETDDGPVRVGGRVAALEDVEAHEIEIERA